MTLVELNKAEVGMIVENDIRNIRNQVLVPAGVALTSTHIRRLKGFGIDYVDIQDGTMPSSLLDSLDDRALQRIASLVDTHFALNPNPTDVPFIAHCRQWHANYLTGVLDDLEEDTFSPTDTVVPPMPAKWQNLDTLLEMSQDLHSLPDVYQKLISVMNQPDASVAQMGNLISYEPSLAARLIRVANSAYYSLNTQLETVSRAITVIGINDLKNMVLASSLISQFSGDISLAVNMETFWKHSIACGTIARNTALETRQNDSERFFTMGLLHDIGKLILYSQMPSEYSALERHAFDECLSLTKKERAYFGYSHCRVGADLLKKWNFPITHQEATAFHHRPATCRSATLEASIIHIADIIAHVIGYSASYPSRIPPLDVTAVDQLNLSEKKLYQIISCSQKQIEELTSKLIGQK